MPTTVQTCVRMCGCVCVWREREREREQEGGCTYGACISNKDVQGWNDESEKGAEWYRERLIQCAYACVSVCKGGRVRVFVESVEVFLCDVRLGSVWRQG